jgi:hypothetical protein
MIVTLGSELREVLDGLYCAGTILKVGCVLEDGEERARARAASLLSSGDVGDVGRLRLSDALSCRTFDCVLTNFEKKPGAIVLISAVNTWNVVGLQGVVAGLSPVRYRKANYAVDASRRLVCWRLACSPLMEPSSPYDANAPSVSLCRRV